MQKGTRDTAVRKPTRTRMLQTEKSTESKSTNVRHADKSDENVQSWEKTERRTTRTAKSQKSCMSISDIVQSKDTGNTESSVSSFYTFRSDDEDEDLRGSSSAYEMAQPTRERNQGASKGEKMKVTGKRKAETPTSRPRKCKKLDSEAGDIVVSNYFLCMFFCIYFIIPIWEFFPSQIQVIFPQEDSCNSLPGQLSLRIQNFAWTFFFYCHEIFNIIILQDPVTAALQ